MVHHFSFKMTPTPGADLMLYNEKYQLDGVIIDASNIQFEDERVTRARGMEVLKFSVAFDNPYFSKIAVEKLIEFGGRWFRIKLITDNYYSERTADIVCYALWYELAEGGLIGPNFTNATVASAFTIMFSGMQVGWRLPPSVQGIRISSFTGKYNTRLYHLRLLAKRYELELLFGYERTSTGVRTIIIPQHSDESQIETPLVVGRSLSKVVRTVDSRELCTRFSLLSTDEKGNLFGIASINGGKNYLENVSYFTSRGVPARIIDKSKTDNRFSDLQSMKDEMLNYLATYSRPFISYEVDVLLYSDLGIPELLWSQFVLDEHYAVAEWRRVTKRTLNYSDLTKSSISFEDSRKDSTDDALDDQDFKNEVKETTWKNAKTVASLDKRITALESKK